MITAFTAIWIMISGYLQEIQQDTVAKTFIFNLNKYVLWPIGLFLFGIVALSWMLTRDII